MKKVAIILSEKYWWNFRYTGIRSIAINLKNALDSLGYQNDLVAIKNQKQLFAKKSEFFGRPEENYFFELTTTKDVIDSNFHVKDCKISSFFDIFKTIKRTKPDFEYQLKATDLSCYDVIFVLTNWQAAQIAPQIQKNQKVIVVFHDNLPLLNNFTKRSSSLLRFFAHRGIEECFKRNYTILCVSKQAEKQLIDFYQNASYFDQNLLKNLSQIILPIFYEKNQAESNRENAVVLGNIHSKRKRLDYAIKVLKLSKNIQKIYIYGGNCKPFVILNFFIKFFFKCKIEWYTVASTQTVLKMLDNAKVLLFPSDFEGIGIPIIEAQMRGLMVLCQNKSPMKDLISGSSQTLTMNPKLDAKILDEMLSLKKQSFNENLTREKFSIEVFNAQIKNILDE